MTAETFATTALARATLRAPVARTSAFFFFLFAPTGIAQLGLSLWLADRGVSDARIGLVNAAPLVFVVILGLSVGRLADRAANWRGVIVTCSLIAAITPALLAFAHAYWTIAIVWSLTAVPFLAMSPVADAAAIRLATQAGRSYGSIRVWGTIGFIAVIVVVGFAFQAFGVAAFIPLLVAASLVRLAFAYLLPPFHAPSTAGTSPRPERPFVVTASRDLKQLMRPFFLAPIFAGALLAASHSALNGFGPLIWKSQGDPDWLIGVFLAIAPTAEVSAMLLSHRLLSMFPARVILFGCCLVGVVRWSGYAVPHGPAIVALLQALHLVTYGLGYVVMVVFVDAWSDPSIAAQTQTFATLARNVVMIATFAAFGVLTARIGADVFYVAAGMCAVGAALCAWSLAIQPPRRLRRP
jgi:PPP family 3-phenylpropionic acid transporter